MMIASVSPTVDHEQLIKTTAAQKRNISIAIQIPIANLHNSHWMKNEVFC